MSNYITEMILRERIAALETELEDHAGLLAAAVEAVNEAAPADWQGPPMPGDAPPPFIRWQAKRIAELEADNASEGRWAEQYFRERQEAYRLLRAALDENPTWHTEASMEAERLLGDEPDEADPLIAKMDAANRRLSEALHDICQLARKPADDVSAEDWRRIGWVAGLALEPAGRVGQHHDY